jgi:hypothetical protein
MQLNHFSPTNALRSNNHIMQQMSAQINKVPLPIKQSYRDNSNVSDKRGARGNMYNAPNSDSLGTNEFNNVSIE